MCGPTATIIRSQKCTDYRETSKALTNNQEDEITGLKAHLQTQQNKINTQQAKLQQAFTEQEMQIVREQTFALRTCNIQDTLAKVQTTDNARLEMQLQLPQQNSIKKKQQQLCLLQPISEHNYQQPDSEVIIQQTIQNRKNN